MFQLQDIDHVALTVRDVPASVRWYQSVLGFQRMHQDAWGDFPAVVGLGSTALALFPVKQIPPNEPPGPETICFRHVAFRADRLNFERARETLSGRGIAVTEQDHGIAHSIYFLDPDGHQLEITTYQIEP